MMSEFALRTVSKFLKNVPSEFNFILRVKKFIAERMLYLKDTYLKDLKSTLSEFFRAKFYELVSIKDTKLCDNNYDNLLNNIKHARNEWETAVINYEFVNDADMVDYYLYLMKACEVRYESLIRTAKREGINWG